MAHLTASEDDTNLDFVTLIQELMGFAGLCFQVMLADDGRELYLLKFAGFMILAGNPVLLLLLKAEFSVIEDFADRRIGVRGDAIEIKTVANG